MKREFFAAVILLFAAGLPLASQPQYQQLDYAIKETFPNWWTLRFTKCQPASTVQTVQDVSSTGLGYTVLPFSSAPAYVQNWALAPTPPNTTHPANVYLFANVATPDPATFLDVYVVHWNEGGHGPVSATSPTLPLRLKLFIQHSSETPPSTLWRLRAVFVLDVTLQNLKAQPSADDVAVIPAFRSAPSPVGPPAWRSVNNRRIFENPFADGGLAASPTHGWRQCYPCEWNLPFFAFYDKTKKTGLWFFREDHEIPHNMPNDPAPRPTYRDYSAAGASRWQGFSVLEGTVTEANGEIQVRMMQQRRTDGEPQTALAPMLSAPFVQSGNVLVEEIAPSYSAWSGFVDWFSVLSRYKWFVNRAIDSPFGVHSNSYQVNRRLGGLPGSYYGPVGGSRQLPAKYRDLPLLLGPFGHWERYGNFPCQTAMSSVHEGQIRGYWDLISSGTDWFNCPGIYFQDNPMGNWTAPGGASNFFGPDIYTHARAEHASLIRWAHGADASTKDGFVAGYTFPVEVPVLWASPTVSYSSLYVVQGDCDQRIVTTKNGFTYSQYAWNYQPFHDNVLTPYLFGTVPNTTLTGALNPPVSDPFNYLDGLHVDGVFANTIDSDATHDTTGSGQWENAGVNGIRAFLEKGHSLFSNSRIFDQEAAVEAFLDTFDSTTGQDYFDEWNPPMLRMVYGNVIRYTMGSHRRPGHVMRGYYLPWNDHPVKDLYDLTMLKDGGLPVVLFFDNETGPTPHASFFNLPEDSLLNPEPVTRLLRSYLKNYSDSGSMKLKEIFAGSVARLPSISAPASGLYWEESFLSAYQAPIGQSFQFLWGDEPIVKGTAYRYRVGTGALRAAVVLVDWGTVYRTQAGELPTGLKVFRRDGLTPQQPGNNYAPAAPYTYTPPAKGFNDELSLVRSVQIPISLGVDGRPIAGTGGQFAQATHSVTVSGTMAGLGLSPVQPYVIKHYELTPQGRTQIGPTYGPFTGSYSVVITTKASTMNVLTLEP